LWQRAFGRTLRVVAAPSSRGESVDAEAQENIAARAARISALTTR
jgi:hypothetical protein